MDVRTVRVKIDASTYGISHSETQDACFEGYQAWTKAAEQFGTPLAIRFQRVTRGEDYNMGSKAIYLGRSNGLHEHGRGIAQMNGRSAWIHSGYIPAGTGNRQPGAYFFKMFASPEAIVKVSSHEVGHNFGLRHTNASTRMNSSASAPISKDEVRLFARKAGFLPEDPDEPETPDGEPEEGPFDEHGNFKPGVIVEALNIPCAANGSILYKGKRYFVKGQNIVVSDARVIVHENTETVNCGCVKPSDD